MVLMNLEHKAYENSIRRKAQSIGLRLVKSYTQGNNPDHDMYGVINRNVKYVGDLHKHIYIFTLDEVNEYLDALIEEKNDNQ